MFKKRKKQEVEKKNRWITKERYLFTINLVLSIIISIIVSIFVYNLNKNDILIKGLSNGMNISLSIIMFLFSLVISFVIIANLSNDLFNKIKK